MMIKTVVGAGVRQEELQQLSVEALTEGSAWMIKHGRKRLVEIPEPLRSELLAYAAEEGIQTGPIFVTKNGVAMSHPHIWKDIKRVCREAGIAEEKAGPSSLYKLSRATYLNICSTDTSQTKERLQRLLEKEEQYVSWNDPNP
jgi:site-specific recombinase XerD